MSQCSATQCNVVWPDVMWPYAVRPYAGEWPNPMQHDPMQCSSVTRCYSEWLRHSGRDRDELCMQDLCRTLSGVPSCALESSHAGWVCVAVLSSTNEFKQTWSYSRWLQHSQEEVGNSYSCRTLTGPYLVYQAVHQRALMRVECGWLCWVAWASPNRPKAILSDHDACRKR